MRKSIVPMDQLFRLTENHRYWFLITLVLVTLTIQGFLIAMFYNPDVLTSSVDPQQFWAIATNLHTTGFYSFDGITPTRMRQPLYPSLLAILQFIPGPTLIFVYVSGALLNIGTLLVTYFFARHLYGNAVATLTSLQLGLYVPFLATSSLVMNEALFLFLLTTAIFLLVSIASRGHHAKTPWILSGIFFATATLTRPVALLIPMLILVTIVVFWGWKHFTSMIVPVLIFFSVFVIALIPWGVRNGIQLGEFSVTSSELGAALWFASQRNWLQEVWGPTDEVIQEQRSLIGDNPLISSEANRILMGVATSRIKQDPLGFLTRGLGRGVIASSFLPGIAGPRFFRDVPTWLPLGSIPFQIGLLSLAGIGLWTSRRENKTVFVFFAIILFFASTEAFLSSVLSRYALPTIPFLILLASIGFMRLNQPNPTTQ